MIHYQEAFVTLYQGHALDVLRELAAESVDCVITSPPYWGLRSYKTEPVIWGDNHCEHEWVSYRNAISFAGKTKTVGRVDDSSKTSAVPNSKLNTIRASTLSNSEGDIPKGDIFSKPIKERRTTTTNSNTSLLIHPAIPVNNSTNEIGQKRSRNRRASHDQAFSRNNAIGCEDSLKLVRPEVQRPIRGVFPCIAGNKQSSRADAVSNIFGKAKVSRNKTNIAIIPNTPVRDEQPKDISQLTCPFPEEIKVDRVTSGIRKGITSSGTHTPWPITELPSGSVNELATVGTSDYLASSTIWSRQTSPIHETIICQKCGAVKCELGLEPTIELYISHLLQIFDEVKRVLKKTGTCWVNIGDTYAGSGCGTNDYRTPASRSINKSDVMFTKMPPQQRLKDIPAKSLCLIPERFALGMIERGWILRNVIIWYKSNPMPESVKDRFTGTYEYIYFFTKSRKYWFEQQFDEYTEPLNRWGGPKITNVTSTMEQYREEVGGMGKTSLNTLGKAIRPNDLGRNKRDVWEICTQPTPEEKVNGEKVKNYATFPEDLCKTPILSGCPSMICKKCGKARKKIYSRSEWESHQQPGMAAVDIPDSPMYRGGHHNDGLPYRATTKDVGYSDCGCNAGWTSGVLLDPFCGSGTALAVAKSLGRRAIGIEINPKYCDLTVKRIQKIPIPMDLSGERHG